MLFACLAIFLLASSKEDAFGWDMAEGGLFVMEGSGSRVERGPILDKAAVMVAMEGERWREGERELKTGAH